MIVPMKNKLITLETYDCYGHRVIGTVDINLYNVSSLEIRVIESNTVIEVRTYSDESFHLNDTGYRQLRGELKKLDNV